MTAPPSSTGPPGLPQRLQRGWGHLRQRAGRLDARQALLLLAGLLLAAGWLLPSLQWLQPRSNQVVVLDITQSMNVVDQAMADHGSAPTPTAAATSSGPATLPRLAAAKLALRQVLDALPCGSRLGWAIFTEHRTFLLLLPVEVCAHRAELRDSLAGIHPGMAWAGDSEIAKGLHSALDLTAKLPGQASLVFVTDGHESPPLSPRHRPHLDDKPGAVAGVIVGVGATLPAAIPKTDPQGRPLGHWSADEVQQTDPRSQGRGGSVVGEVLAEEGGAQAGGLSAGPGKGGVAATGLGATGLSATGLAATGLSTAGLAAAGLGATPGSEHLSALREPYLQLLASERGLAYHRLQQPEALAQALRVPALLRPVAVPLQARAPLGWLALALLAWRQALGWRRRAGGGPGRR